jgi:capsular polysaccharide transport system permease protein
MPPATFDSPHGTRSPLSGEWRPRTPSLWRCFVIQCSTVHALMIQSILQHQRRSKLGYFWELFDPMMQIGIWFALFTLIRGPRVVYDMNLFLFLSTGIVSLFFFQKIAQEMPGAMRRFAGFARLPAVNQADTLIAGGLLEAVLMTVVASILWGVIILGGFGFAPADPLGVIAALTCLGFLGFGFGWFNATALVFVPVYGKFLQIIFRILFFTSGAIFPLERMPPDIFRYLQWNPVYQGVDLVRSAWSYTHDTYTSSGGYVLLCGASLLLLGLLLDKPAERARARTRARK